MKYVIALLAVLVMYALVRLAPTLYSIKGSKALQEGNREKADRCLKRASEIFGGSVSAKITYAMFLMRGGDFDKAENLLNELILGGNLKPQDKVALKVYRCMIYQKTGREQDAREDAEELFENTKNTLTYGLITYIRQLSGNAELDLCLEAYEYNSDDRDICDGLAVAYIRNGDYEKAAAILEKLRDEYPDFTEAFYHSAVIAVKIGDKNAAEKYFGKIAECKKNALTTISQKEIEELGEEIRGM